MAVSVLKRKCEYHDTNSNKRPRFDLPYQPDPEIELLTTKIQQSNISDSEFDLYAQIRELQGNIIHLEKESERRNTILTNLINRNNRLEDEIISVRTEIKTLCSIIHRVYNLPSDNPYWKSYIG